MKVSCVNGGGTYIYIPRARQSSCDVGESIISEKGYRIVEVGGGGGVINTLS